MGKLIAIEGTDYSFKETQSRMLHEYILNNISKNCQLISYPNYESDSSFMIRQMLSGVYGDKPTDIDPAVASVFYMIDRFHDYLTNWKNMFKLEDSYIVADRYSGSNIIHQSTKYNNQKSCIKMAKWLLDMEHVRFGLPVPTITIFISVPPEMVFELKKKERLNNLKGGIDKDIHEIDETYLISCHAKSLELCNLLGWKIVSGVGVNGLKTKEEIHNDILDILKGENYFEKTDINHTKRGDK